jgi:hypothetical protein
MNPSRNVKSIAVGIAVVAVFAVRFAYADAAVTRLGHTRLGQTAPTGIHQAMRHGQKSHVLPAARAEAPIDPLILQRQQLQNPVTLRYHGGPKSAMSP